MSLDRREILFGGVTALALTGAAGVAEARSKSTRRGITLPRIPSLRCPDRTSICRRRAATC